MCVIAITHKSDDKLLGLLSTPDDYFGSCHIKCAHSFDQKKKKKHLQICKQVISYERHN